MIGQLAIGGQAPDVGRGDRGVVDDHARGLHARPAGGGADVVDRGRGQLGQRRHVIEQSDQTTCHADLLCRVDLGETLTGHLPGPT